MDQNSEDEDGEGADDVAKSKVSTVDKDASPAIGVKSGDGTHD